jgi:diguanylate cyclase (GGDEF)-like protein
MSLLLRSTREFEAALDHAVRHHEISFRLLREQNAERAQVIALRMGRERARLEAEVMRLRTRELESHLQSTISEKDRFERAATQDPLTGIGNRRRFDAALGRLLDERLEFAVIMLDLDHFKEINDSVGHVIGDQVLVEVARLLERAARSGDEVARFGGEEFVVLFVGALGDAVRLAERIRSLLAAHDWSALHRDLRVTGSLGVAASPRDGASDVVARADANLYRAKHAGRDRVAWS